MLRREVDYEPQSPKKAQHASLLGVAAGRSVSQVRERMATGSEHSGSSPRPVELADDPEAQCAKAGLHQRIRTTDEKKELLGTMLGNVDALVEGVRKAGIWGLS